MATEKQLHKNCPVCGSPEFEPTTDAFDIGDVLRRWEKEIGARFSPEVWREYTEPASTEVTLHRCRECGFAMFEPVVVGSSEFYKGITTKDGECYSPNKWEFLEAIRDLKQHGVKRILDIGSGSGYFLDLVREKAAALDYAGYEFNSEMAELARSKGHKVFYGPLPEAVRNAEADEPFDAITIFQVLEHVSEPMEFLQTARGLLAPKGLLIVGVPDAGGPVRHFSSALTDIPPHHVSRWRETSFRHGMSRIGLEVLRVAYEPLPSYLWGSYLPVILERDFKPALVGKALNKTGLTNLAMRVLSHLHVKWIPGIPGHSLYVLLRRED